MELENVTRMMTRGGLCVLIVGAIITATVFISSMSSEQGPQLAGLWPWLAMTGAGLALIIASEVAATFFVDRD